MAVQLNDIIHPNNNNSQEIACIQLKISYLNTARIVNEAVHEVKDLLEYNLDKDLLDWGIRKEICTNIEEANYKTYGRCMQFDLIEVVDCVFLGTRWL